MLLNYAYTSRMLLVLLLVICSNQAYSQRLLLRLMGIKNPTPKSTEHIRKHIQKVSGHTGCIYEIDTAYYFHLYRTFDTTTAKGKKQAANYLQPVQAIYFDNSTGQMVASLANCDADPLGTPLKLTWTKEGRMDVFPPKHTAFTDTLFQLTSVLHTLKPIDKCGTPETAEYDYTVLIFWSEFIGKNHERLVKEAVDNIRSEMGKTILPVYISMDNFFAKYATVSM